MRILMAVALAVVAFGAPAGAAEAGFDALWAQANAHYKQALYTTNQGQMAKAVEETAAAHAAWSELAQRFEGAPPKPYPAGKEWREFLSAVQGDLENARRLLADGKAKEAHDAMEPVRYRWAKLREGIGLDLFGDRLTHYHDAMEAVAMSVQGKDPGALSPAARRNLRALLPDVQATWEKVERGAMPTLPDPDQRRFRAALQAGRESVQALERALEGTDDAALVRAAQGLKPAFMKLFLGFA